MILNLLSNAHKRKGEKMKIRLSVSDWGRIAFADIFVIVGTLFIAGLVALDRATSYLVERWQSVMYGLRMATLGIATLAVGAVCEGWAAVKRGWRKLRIPTLILILLATLAVGCATSGPRTMSEAFPARNQDPRVGIVVIAGTAHINLFLYRVDSGNRLLIEQDYVAGANRWLTVDGRRIYRHWVQLLEPGPYEIEIWPFYYQNQIFPPSRVRVDLPRAVTNLYVGSSPTNVYYEGRHWGWILWINSGDIPDTAHGLPGVKVNLGGGLGILGDIFR